MLTCCPCDLANAFNRLLKSISSATNSSWLKPPNFRNARASQKMNDPAIQRCQRLRTIPKADKPDRPTNRLIEFNGSAAANTTASLHQGRHFGEQFGTGKGIGIDKDKPLSMRCRRTRVSCPRNLIDCLE